MAVGRNMDTCSMQQDKAPVFLALLAVTLMPWLSSSRAELAHFGDRPSLVTKTVQVGGCV